MEHCIINIGRQYGSGGREIGEKIARRLHFAYYDKELISLASKESGLGKEFFEAADEKKTYSLTGGWLGLRNNFISSNFLENYLNTELVVGGSARGHFSVAYFDSSENRLIQIADIFANLLYSQEQTGQYAKELGMLRKAGILKSIFDFP